jgi:hypothetical protein
MVTMDLVRRSTARGEALATGFPVRKAIFDDDGDVQGWVTFDEIGDFATFAGVLVPVEFHVRIPGGAGRPSLRIRFEVRDGGIVCTALNIESKHQEPAVIPKHLEIMRQELNNWRDIAAELVMRKSREAAPGMVDPVTASKAKAAARPRRRKMTPELLAEVAALYRDNLGERSTWEVIAQRFGVEPQTAGRYVVQARKAGYLPETDRGIGKA